MIIEIFVLCDAATDQQGKLNVLGSFDTLYGREFPVIHPSCAIALRLRFRQSQWGNHKISLHLIDEDGKFVVPKMEGNLNVAMTEGQNSVAINLIFNLNGLKFENPGFYEVNLLVDEKQLGSIPLQVKISPS